MKIANALLIPGTVVALAACTTIRPMPLPDGTMDYALECNAMLDTVDECYARVAELCPQGYSIVAQSQSALKTFDPFLRTMHVRCSKPAG